MKNKLLIIGSYALAIALAVTGTLALTQGRGAASKLTELESLIESRFIGEADRETMEDAAAAAMVNATGDKWSYYIPASEYAAYRERMDNAYVGIGITIQQDEAEKGFFVKSVTPGSPAEEAGILVGDLLIKVEDQDIRGEPVDLVHNLVRGEEGTSVRLIFLRQGDPVNFTIRRRQIHSPVAEYEMVTEDIGLVTIYNFDSRCAQETIAAIETLQSQGAKKLIFDVRNNPGGYAHEMVEILDYLLPEGDLFRTRTYDGKENVDRSDAAFLDLPMAVLVNGSSYSAAEFFAAALQEYEAAIVVGENTTGKGYFQTTYQLSDGSAVALSTGEYFTPSGKNLADIGITPDVPSQVSAETAAAIRNGTLEREKDPQLQAAIRAVSK